MKETKYKQTDLGIIPEDWEIVSIRDFLTLLTDYDANGSFADMANNVHAFFGSGYAWYVRATDLEQKLPLSEVRYVDESSYKYLRKTSLHGGELLIAKRGDIGKVYYFEMKTERATLAPNLYLLKLRDGVNSKWLYYYFKSTLGQSLLKGINASTSLGAIYKEDVKNLPVYCISYTEQERIAEALSDVDGLLRELDAEIAKKRAIKQGAMQELLTGKRRLEGFGGEWEEKKLSNLFDFFKGYGLSKDAIKANGKNKCILYGEIFTTYDTEVKNCASMTDHQEGLPSKIGDVLMPGSTTTSGIDLVKAISVNEDNIQLGGDIIVLRPKVDYINSYFMASLISNIQRNKIAEMTQGITIIHLHSKDIVDIKYTIPVDKAEQTAIAKILSDMDADIEALEAKREKYAAVKQGMMQELLTGKIRLV